MPALSAAMTEPAPERITSRHALATRLVFFAAGLTMAAWGPLVPFARQRLGLDEAALGSLLLCLGLGSVVAMPFSGHFAARFGPRRVILIAGAFPILMLPILALTPNVPVVAVALAIFGAGAGTVDVVMNIQATLVERALGRAMMSGFHGLFSVGALIGAAGMTAFLGAGARPILAGGIIVLLALGLAFAFRSGLLARGGEAEGPPFVIPRGPAILIGVLCFVLFLIEGSMLDWTGVFLIAERGLPTERGGIGYVAFATTMTIGRLTGDRIVAVIGPRRALVGGATLAAAGLLLAVLIPSVVAGLVGFALVGAGAANSVPVLFSAAGRQRAMPANLAIAAVTTMGYAGILAGPAAIGFVARGATLPIAFALVAGLLVFVAFAGGRVADAPE